jgi:predicted RNA-binding protein with PIN domain
MRHAPTDTQAPGSGLPSNLFFLAGVGRTVSLVALFVLGGVAAAALAGAPLRPDPYPLPLMGEAGEAGEAGETDEPRVWLVDGFNTLHVALLGGESREGWWRGTARERLLDRVRHFDARGAELWVVFDGSHPVEAAATADAAHVIFAPSADEWLLRRIAHAPDPSALAVVTSDRSLAERARRRGARVVSPGAFLARCPAPDAAGGGTAL